MRRDEAVLMLEWIQSLSLPRGATCLNIGSSTEDYRERLAPYIHRDLIEPLERDGLRFVHCDLKASDGVDEVGDLLDESVQVRLAKYNADLIICSNLLEHLTNPTAFAQACGKLVRPGGYGMFTIPKSFPFHPDPIDTMLRLSPCELANLLPDWNVVKAGELLSGNHLTDLRNSGEGCKRFMKQIARVLVPIYEPRKWRPAAHRLLWLLRPYRISLALLRKPNDTGNATGD